MNRAQGVINIAFGTVKEKVLLVTACFLNFGSEVYRISKNLEFRMETGDKNNRSDGDTNGEAKNQQESQDNAKSNSKTGSTRKCPVLINLIVGHVVHQWVFYLKQTVIKGHSFSWEYLLAGSSISPIALSTLRNR